MTAAPVENKIFISWSGEPSRSIASFLKTWLEEVIDNITVWFSEVDIAAGSRSMQDIEAALKDSKMGIVVTTKATMGKDWINFEAGALSKEVNGDKNRVVPLLIDFDRPTELVGPLNVFQAVTLTKDGLQKLLSTVYDVVGGENKAAAKINRYWQDVEANVDEWRAAAQQSNTTTRKASRPNDEILTEVLAIVRELRDAPANLRDTRPLSGAGYSASSGNSFLRRVREALSSEERALILEYGVRRQDDGEMVTVTLGVDQTRVTPSQLVPIRDHLAAELPDIHVKFVAVRKEAPIDVGGESRRREAT